MVVLNPNNWHWVDKNTLKWSETYFNDKLINFTGEIDDGKKQVTITGSKVQGDSNVSQRKGKPICYFDLNISLNMEVVNSEATEQESEPSENKTSGSISIPEFMHDEDDFEIIVKDITDRDSIVHINKEFLPRLRSLLLEYQKDLLEEHSKDLQH